MFVCPTCGRAIATSEGACPICRKECSRSRDLWRLIAMLMALIAWALALCNSLLFIMLPLLLMH